MDYSGWESMRSAETARQLLETWLEDEELKKVWLTCGFYFPFWQNFRLQITSNSANNSYIALVFPGG